MTQDESPFVIIVWSQFDRHRTRFRLISIAIPRRVRFLTSPFFSSSRQRVLSTPPVIIISFLFDSTLSSWSLTSRSVLNLFDCLIAPPSQTQSLPPAPASPSSPSHASHPPNPADATYATAYSLNVDDLEPSHPVSGGASEGGSGLPRRGIATRGGTRGVRGGSSVGTRGRGGASRGGGSLGPTGGAAKKKQQVRPLPPPPFAIRSWFGFNRESFIFYF